MRLSMPVPGGRKGASVRAPACGRDVDAAVAEVLVLSFREPACGREPGGISGKGPRRPRLPVRRRPAGGYGTGERRARFGREGVSARLSRVGKRARRKGFFSAEARALGKPGRRCRSGASAEASRFFMRRRFRPFFGAGGPFLKVFFKRRADFRQERWRMPRVSVLMPVYNTRPEHLREAVSSILAQTFTDFELIVLNDGCR